MNETSRAGVVLGKGLVHAYDDNPRVTAVMVGGSVALGCADNYSDLEIGVFWGDPPTTDERKAAILRNGGELLSFDRSPGHEFYALSAAEVSGIRLAGSMLISMHHMTVDQVDQCISDVVERYDTSLDKQAVLAAIQRGIPLHGERWLGELKARIDAYPLGLAIKMVQENLWFGPWFRPEAYAARDDLLALHQHLLWTEQALLRVLAGLNRVYYPSSEHKWIDRQIAQMKVAPVDLSSRLKRALQIAPLDAWRELRALIDETVELVERELPEVNRVLLFESHPEVNTTWARRRWQPEPAYTLLGEIAARVR